MQNYLIKNIQVVNEGHITVADVLLQNDRIERIDPQINLKGKIKEINGEEKFLLPGCIDDQVHFREPGLTHKATIHTEAKAAVAGGVTSFMEMPNTLPNALTQELLEEKYAIAARSSVANYSFFMGTGNDNAEQVLKTNDRKKDICGIKIFMGSSTGNMLVDNPNTLDRIFRESELLIATHCEDEKIIRDNYARITALGKKLTAADHPLIRNEEACYESSLYAIQIAKKYNTRLHILHISTQQELQLFTNMFPLKDKRITAEVCVHHLHFTADGYARLGYQIKCNPAIKAPHHKEALWQALLDDRLDVIATDHAPHTMEEKGIVRGTSVTLVPQTLMPQTLVPQKGNGSSVGGKTDMAYEKAHAGLPLVQHSLLLMLHYNKLGRISLEKIVQKMSHAVAECFNIAERGYIREGYYADLVIADLGKPYTVAESSLLYKCGWSPLENFTFPASISHTFVNGHLVHENGIIDESVMGMRLKFNR